MYEKIKDKVPKSATSLIILLSVWTLTRMTLIILGNTVAIPYINVCLNSCKNLAKLL